MLNLKQPLQHVLLIDDDDTTNYINKRVVEKAGIAETTSITHNGKEALKVLRDQSEAGAPAPELLFVDIRMSVMDGYEFLDEYQTLEPRQKAQVVIVLSSSASFYDIKKLEEYPEVKKHIAKPLDEFELRDIMNTYFPGHMQ